MGVKSATLVCSLLFQVAEAWEAANRLDYDPSNPLRWISTVA